MFVLLWLQQNVSSIWDSAPRKYYWYEKKNVYTNVFTIITLGDISIINGIQL